MRLIYLDESGNTGNRRDDPDQPLHLIACVIVDEGQVRGLEDAIDTITFGRFPDARLEDGFELHGADLYRGNGLFKGVLPDTRVAAVQEVIAALAQHEAQIGWTAADKAKMYASMHPHRLAFVLLTERVELYLRQADALGLLVADENKELEQRLIDDLDVYKRSTTGFGWRPITIKQIVDSVHFVQSKNNRLIQCADLVAYFVLRGLRLKGQLATRFRAVPEPKGTYPDWVARNASKSDKAVLEIGNAIERLTIFKKVFPA